MLQDSLYKNIRNQAEELPHLSQTQFDKRMALKDDIRVALSYDPQPSLLYGLPKGNKDGIPMQPIIAFIGSSTYNISRSIAMQLRDRIGKTDRL